MDRTRRTRRFAAAVFASVMTLGLALPATSLASGSWETLRSEDGILVQRKDVPGSPFVAFRGEGDVDAPLLAVGNVLVDIAREKEWIDSVADARVLRRVSEAEYVVYSHVATPPTMSDRDFVADVTLSADAPSRTLTIRMRSIDDPSAPRTSYVRGQLEESSFVLTGSADGKKTHVVAEIHCDPKGSIAPWIVNMFQKSWGYNTIASLRKQVRKPDIATNQQLKGLLDARGL
ncbi:MAG TPA: START domain-containing protein [Polyangiaceae bacterium]|jgi:hypothetical protein